MLCSILTCVAGIIAAAMVGDAMRLKPFFTYFGGKWRVAPQYEAPKYSTIVEPFAGSAGYSLTYADRNVVLIDKDPIIAGLWQWLINVPAERIRRLPLVIEHVDKLDVEQGAKWLIGFWLNKGTATPHKSPSKWMRDGTRPKSYWGAEIRERIATQVEHIRHWKAVSCSYEMALQNEATWFVDPPYQVAGRNYRMRDINYDLLSDWCRTLRGQVIVCEAYGARWLPFRPFRSIQANHSRHGGKVSNEVIWTNDNCVREHVA